MKRKMMMIKCACLALSQCKVCLFLHPSNLLSLLTSFERRKATGSNSIYNIFYLYQAGGKVGWNSKELLTFFFLSVLSSYVYEQDLCHLIFSLSAAPSLEVQILIPYGRACFMISTAERRKILCALALLETINKIKSRRLFIKFISVTTHRRAFIGRC